MFNTVLVLPALLLSACNGGFSKSDAVTAMQANEPGIDFDIKDLRCDTAGNDVYSCAMVYTRSAGPGDKTFVDLKNVQFRKVGNGWATNSIYLEHEYLTRKTSKV